MSESPVDKSATTTWLQVIGTAIRLLTFRATREELVSVNWKHFAFGLVCAWVVGVGRHWDNPRVSFLQHLGLGSVFYVFILALFLWLLVWPLRPKNWSYFKVLVFVSLVSPPAILYALPVEKFYSLETANSINAWFLGIVALWRVALLVFFLSRVAQLEWYSVIVATLLPLTIIVVGLTVLNLEKVVFDFMGGVTERSPNDDSYSLLFGLSLISVILFLPVITGYLVIAVLKFVNARQSEELISIK